MGFDLSELMMIMVVALIVIGPERLPKVARTMGLLYGRAQRYVNGVKADISRDLAVDEYRQMQQRIQAEATALQRSVQQVGHNVQQVGHNVDQQVSQLNQAVANQVNEPAVKIESATQPTPTSIPPQSMTVKSTQVES